MKIRQLQEGEVPQTMLREGYNKSAEKYNAFTFRIASPRLEWLAKLYVYLGPRLQESTVLELGCGTGKPCTVDLAQNVGSLIASDISSGQLKFARRTLVEAGHRVTHGESTGVNAPESSNAGEPGIGGADGKKIVRLIEADMLSLSFPTASFDAICAFYSLQSLPIPDQIAVLQNVYNWLKPGGYVLFNCPADEDEGVVIEGWLGMNAFTAGLGEKRVQTVLEEVGFEIVELWTGRMEVDVAFTWVIARQSTAVR